MYIPLPPPQYDHEPVKSYYVQQVTEKQLRQFCNYEDKIPMGCTVGTLIFIKKGLSKEVYELVLRHEKGHVNGWHHN